MSGSRRCAAVTRNELSGARVSAGMAIVALAALGVGACSSAASPRHTAEQAAAQASRVAASAAAAASELPGDLATKVLADASDLRSAAASLASSTAEGAASSLSARASEFDASVSARIAEASASAAGVLKGASGRGNAVADVTLTGLPTANTNGTRAVVVTITNPTSRTASYAVQIDFVDSGGKTVDSAVVAADDVPPGGKATPVAFSRTSAQQTQPRVAKAERY